MNPTLDTPTNLADESAVVDDQAGRDATRESEIGDASTPEGWPFSVYAYSGAAEDPDVGDDDLLLAQGRELVDSEDLLLLLCGVAN
jgi:hypothetical protein